MKRFVVLLGMLFAGSSFADIYDGLIVHFPLDGNADDVSEFRNDGFEYGNIVYEQGEINLALALTNDSSYIVSSDHLNSFRELTVSFWMYPEEDADMIPYTTACGSDRDAGVSFMYTAEKEVQFSVGRAFNCFINASRTTVSTTIDGAGQWYHVVGVYKARSSLALYVNGAKVDEAKASTILVPKAYLSNYQYIGTDLRSPGGELSWNGKIDDVRVYNRALADFEIDDLYRTAVDGCSAPPPSEVAENLDVVIPVAAFNTELGPTNLRLDLEFTGGAEIGEYTWRLRSYQNVDECGVAEGDDSTPTE